MATGYGNFVSGSGYGWRVQVVVNVASETATTITFNVYGQFYNEHRILSFANGSVSGGGQSRSWDGSTRNLNSGNPGTTNFASYSVTLNKGSSARTETFSARFQVTGGYGNGTSNASVGVQVPAITYSAPNAPSNCSASRNSDTQATVTWSNGSTSTTQPRTAVLVERQTDSGSWVQVASLSASATNYSDNGISANHRYAYRVRSQGNGGTSSYSTSGYIYTTPAAPSSVTAAKESTSSVTLSAEGLPAWAEGYEIERTADGGGSWDSVGTADTFPWTDASAPAGTIRYRVRSYRGDLYSVYTESNSITTITPPLAPTVQALPSVVATGSTLTVQWAPNHPDGSAQEQAQVEYTVGSGSAQTATVQGAATSYQLPSSATSSAGTVSVRVRTHGLDEDWGAWSAAQTVRVAVPPSASITVPPIDGARVGSLPLTVEWDASDATGISSQSIALMDSAGRTLYSASLGASERELVLDDSTYLLDNATDYSLRLTVRGGSSLTTTVARSFSTSFAEPARPDAGLSVDPSDLSAAVTVYAGSPSSETGEVIEVPATPGTLVPGFTVFGSTRQNLWANPATKTVNGVTLTANADGSITLSGTATANTWIFITVYNLRQSTRYTLSVDKAIQNGSEAIAGFYAEEFDSADSSTSHAIANGRSSVSFTTKDDVKKAYYGFMAYTGAVLTGTYRVMLNEGDTAEPWCPPGINGVGELSIVTAGKNLLPPYGSSDAAISLTGNSDGTFDLYGTKSGYSATISGGLYLPKGTTLAMSFTGDVNQDATPFLYVEWFVRGAYFGSRRANANAGIITFTIPEYADGCRFGVYVASNTDQYPAQIDIKNCKVAVTIGGASSHEWSPRISETSTPVDLGGHAINSLPDGTRDELRIDGTGAVTLVQRVGVATAPTEASGWMWGQAELRGVFNLPYQGVSSAVNETAYLLCDKFPVRQSGTEGTYAIIADNVAIARVSTADTLAELVPIAGGATYLYPLAAPKEIDLPGIAMPSFPAVDTQVFCASDVPCDVRVDYPGTSSFTVQRVLPDGSRYTVATGLTDGQQALDRLPPLNVDFAYLVTAYAETGVSSTQELQAHVDSGGMEAFNFGRGASIALLMGYNATGSESSDHGGTLYDFATGDGSLPLFYPTGALTGSASRSYAVTSREHANRVRALSREYPEAWFRDFDGNRMLCKAAFSISLVQGSRDVRTIDVTMDECAFEEASNG